MVAFAQWCEVIDAVNAATIMGEDKVENGWQLTCPVTRDIHHGAVPLFEEHAEQYRHLILLSMGFCKQVTP